MHMGIIMQAYFCSEFCYFEAIIYFKPQSFSSKEIPALEKSELKALITVFLVSVSGNVCQSNFYATYIYAFDHTKMKMFETI